MPLQIRDPDLEAKLQAHADAAPVQSDKLNMAKAIIRRAVRYSPRQLTAWINEPARTGKKADRGN